MYLGSRTRWARSGYRSAMLLWAVLIAIGWGAELAAGPQASAAPKVLPYAIDFEPTGAGECVDLTVAFGKDAPPGGALSSNPPSAGRPTTLPTGNARFQGRCALRAVAEAQFGRDGSPADEQIFAARFYVYNGVTGTAAIDLIRLYGGSGALVGRIYYEAGNPAFVLDNDADPADSQTIATGVPPNVWSLIEIEFDNTAAGGQVLRARADIAGAGAGLTRTVAIIDQTARIDYIELGWIAGAGNSGGLQGLLFDAYDSRSTPGIPPLRNPDPNNDGLRDLADLDPLLAEVQGGPLVIGQPDCNFDGGVDNTDVSCLLGALPTQFDSIPAPNSTITINDIAADGTPTLRALALRNLGAASVEVGSLSGLSAPLQISPTGGTSLATFDGNNAAVYTIQCEAAALGSVNQTLTIRDSGGGTLATYPVVCNGVSPPQFASNPAPGVINLSDPVDGAATATSIVVSNTAAAGSGDLLLTAEVGLNPRFSFTPTSAQTVAAGNNVTYTVRCNTDIVGPTSTTLTLTNNAGGPAAYTFVCTGTPVFGSNPAPGNTIVINDPIDGAASTVSLVVSNASAGTPPPTLTVQPPSGLSAPLSIAPLSLEAIGATAVTYTISCNAVSTVPVSQFLSLAHDGAGSPAQYPVTCTGTAPEFTSDPTPGSDLTLADTQANATPSVQIAVSNTTPGHGAGFDLNVSSCAVTSVRFAVTPSGFTLAPATSNSLTVRCTVPATDGERQSGVLSCNTNDPLRPVVRYNLACTNLDDGGSGVAREQRLRQPPDGNANDGAGTGVAIGGPLAVITAPGAGGSNAGRIYLYVQNPDGSYGDAGGGQAKDGPRLGKNGPSTSFDNPLPPPPMGGDKWGSAVAVSGDGSIVAVGAPDGGGDGQGRVVVFQEPVSGWGNGAPTVTVLGPGAGGGLVPDDFGTAIAIDSSTNAILIGAPGTDVGASGDAGALYAFQSSGGSYGTSPSATMQPPAPAGGDKWGAAVDAANGVVIFGAPGSGTQLGNAYVANLAGTGFTGTTAVPPAGGGQGGDKWGSSVAIAGGTIAIGAPGQDTSVGADSGAVGVFTLGGGLSLTPSGTLLPTQFGGNAQGMGSALDTNGATIVVGAPLGDPNTNADQGLVYIYGQPENGWGGMLSPDSALVQPGGQPGDLFGTSVSIFSTYLASGAPGDDVDDGLGGTFVDQGSADVYALDRILRDGFQ